MNTDHFYDNTENSVKFNTSDLDIHTFGGEIHDDMGIWDAYGIQLGDLTIHDLQSPQMIELGVTIINHLIVNGHNFEFSDKDPYHKFLEYKK